MTRRSSSIESKPRGASDAPRDTAAPWSITLPVAAGVFLGSLVLALLLLAYLQGQKNAVPSGAAHRVDAPATTAAAPPASTTAPASTDTQHLPKLPGLIEANRLRLKTACIAGTIGHRRSNGWVQAVARNAPRRCVATTQ
jgi:hypothetical protein